MKKIIANRINVLGIKLQEIEREVNGNYTTNRSLHYESGKAKSMRDESIFLKALLNSIKEV